MTEKQPDYEKIRQRAEKRVRSRSDFFQHMAVYVIVNLGLWSVYILTKELIPFPWPVFITLAWGVGLSLHGVDVYFNSSLMEARREAAIMREMERELALYRQSSEEPYSKPKRDRVLRLTEEGEMVPDDDDQPIASERRSGG